MDTQTRAAIIANLMEQRKEAIAKLAECVAETSHPFRVEMLAGQRIAVENITNMIARYQEAR